MSEYILDIDRELHPTFVGKIVRCRECRYYRHNTCTRFGIQITRQADHYCSEGKMKDTDETELPV